MSSRNKLILIGLDAATFDIIEPMVERGELPNMAGLFQSGSRGRLTSTHPALTPPAWVTLLTGKNPGKHGVFDFNAMPFDPESMSFSNYNSIKCATLWELLKDSGLKFGVVHYPMTYPPPSLNGFSISGIDTPSENITYSYPEDLVAELRNHGIDYRVKLVDEDSSGKEEGQLLESMFQIEEERKNAFLYLIRNKPWDIFIGVFMLLDRVQHLSWHSYDDPGYMHDKESSAAVVDAVQGAYRLIDQFIGEITSAVDPDTYVMLASDHGFAKREQIFFINEWLRREGLLTLKKFSLLKFLRNPKFHEVQKPGSLILARLGLSSVGKVLPDRLLQTRFKLRVPLWRNSVSGVDWSKTKAYGSAYGIYVNLRGRTSHGTVEPGQEYERIREQILQSLGEVSDPVTGEKPILVARKKEDVYSGPYMDMAPDLVFDYINCKPLPLHMYRFSKILVRKRAFGTHHPEGIFSLAGPGVKANHRISQCHIADVAPTLMYLLGHPIPTDFDGQVLTDLFDKDYVQNHPIQFQDPLEIDLQRGNERETYTPEETSLIAARLKDLGYME